MTKYCRQTSIILVIVILFGSMQCLYSEPSSVQAATIPSSNANQTALIMPSFRWPWSYKENGNIKWAGGPHSWSGGGNLTARISASRGSGLDFAKGGASFAVVSMASGIVIKNKCGFWGFGCIVAIRNDVGGSVIIYAHLKGNANVTAPLNNISEGKWYSLGTVIGEAGQSGGQTAVHLHIELRDGAATCNAPKDSINGDDCGDIGFAGNPVGWDGRQLVDGYRINGYFDYQNGCSPGADCDTIFNYDGSAVKDSIANPYIPFPYTDVGVNEEISRNVEAFVDRSFLCLSKTNCEIVTENELTVFAGQGAFNGGGGILYSTNGLQEPPPPPPPGCLVSELQEPPNDQSTQASITFRWKPVDCAQNRYVIRIKTVPAMEAGGQEILNRSINTPVFYSTQSDIPSQWYNRDLYWSVIPEVRGRLEIRLRLSDAE